MFPIIVPSTRHTPSRCPECSRVEDIRQVCHHCGYEYRHDGPDRIAGFLGLVAALIIIAGVWWGAATGLGDGYSRPELINSERVMCGFLGGLVGVVAIVVFVGASASVYWIGRNLFGKGGDRSRGEQ